RAVDRGADLIQVPHHPAVARRGGDGGSEALGGARGCDRAPRPRDDRRHQRDHRAPGGAHRARHHPGLPRRPGDRSRQPSRSVQPLLREAAAVRPPATAIRGHREDVLPRRGPPIPRRARAQSGGPLHPGGRRGGGGRLLSPRLGEPGSRAAGGRASRRAAPGRRDRRVPRGERSVARVRADEHGGAVRLREAGRPGLPRSAPRSPSSGGGVASFERAMRAPINLLESGPVAGVLAAAEAGRRLGASDVLALDVGGTTAKTSAVIGGRLRIETLHHIGRTPRFAGYPVQVPVVEIVEIGAGGGSIAWADEAGGLHVGPRSAGAEPGPACYGTGGEEPTLTDANLVAGRLDPEYFLGGSMRLDPDAAWRALERLGASLHVSAR